MKKFAIASLFVMILLMNEAPDADAQKANYDEAQVPKFELPQILELNDGTKVSSKSDWKKRRLEIVKLFGEHVYGFSPKADSVKFELLETSDDAMAGKAIRKQVKVTTTRGDQSHDFEVLIYLPKSSKAVPIFVGLNFRGNHTIENLQDDQWHGQSKNVQ